MRSQRPASAQLSTVIDEHPFCIVRTVTSGKPNHLAQPYGSARDLPSFREIDEMLRGGKLLTRFIARDQRAKMLELEREVNRMVDLVDRFYEVLGPRHWVYTDAVRTDDVESILAETSDPTEFEERFIATFRPRLEKDFWNVALLWHEALRARRSQLTRARDHYLAAQYDSCTLQLIAVMDGFVNDFQPELRQGLHARNADEMVAWDSVVGHHQGLTNALQPFRETIRKRRDDEVFEVFRNGIVHGTVTNFDNVVVAAKAWNLLFAVTDWAKATQKAAKPVEAKPTARSTWNTLAEHIDNKRHRDAFVPTTIEVTAQGFAVEPIVERSVAFMEYWKQRNFGQLASYPMVEINRGLTRGRAPQFARECFDEFALADFELHSLSYTMPSVAEVTGVATVNGQLGTLHLRWIFQNDDGDFKAPPQDGAWRQQRYSPTACWKPIDDPA